MKLAAFRELLERRVDNGDLKILIKSVSEDLLGSLVHELLNKMALSGSSPNHSLVLAGGHNLPVDEKFHPLHSMDAALLHDSLSHHLTHYKAALKAGDRKVADQHLAQVMKTVNYGKKLGGTTKLSDLSAGQVRLTSHGGTKPLDPRPWEMNYLGFKGSDKGTYNGSDPKGFNMQTSGAKSKFPDFRYMEMTPHPHDLKRSPEEHHGEGYPFHKLEVNGRHVDIQDVPHEGEFTPHIFDSHPSVQHTYTHSNKMSQEDANQAADDYKKWTNSPGMETWLANQEKNYNPNRGLEPSAPIHSNAEETTHHLELGNTADGRNARQKEIVPQAAGESLEESIARITGKKPATPKSEDDIHPDLAAALGSFSSEDDIHPDLAAALGSFSSGGNNG